MNDLPSSPSVGNNPITNKPIIQLSNTDVQGGVGGKEKEVGGITSAEFPLKDVTGAEVALPKEVASAGVKIQPTTVPVPQKATNAGLQSVGANTPVPGPTSTVTLPLTNDQITKGLHENVTSSWRWLAEWCLRKLKQLHQGIARKKT